MSSEADAIAALVLEQFDRLPAKRKPGIRSNGIQEWVPLCGIVAKGPQWMKCVSLATGMKCLPMSKIPLANGVAVHDWHAEILAIRALNHFIFMECRALLLGRPSEYLQIRQPEQRNYEAEDWHGQPFAWKQDVTLHLYCSEAPCGDASMELTMATQDDPLPWDVPATLNESSSLTSSEDALPGRAYFSQLGIVRRKPARGDAPPTLSKSCSDKLALKQCTSLLSSLTSLLVCPANAYLRSIVLPEAQYSAIAWKRCFSPDGRMRSVAGKKWSGGYCFKPFAVETTDVQFQYSKQAVMARSAKIDGSNLAVAWTLNGLESSLLGGVLNGRKQFDLAGASIVSRRKLWELAVEIVGLADNMVPDIRGQLSLQTYRDVKHDNLLSARTTVKRNVRQEALRGWVENVADDGFRLTPTDTTV